MFVIWHSQDMYPTPSSKMACFLILKTNIMISVSTIRKYATIIPTTHPNAVDTANAIQTVNDMGPAA